jgi:6-phosphogluconolactonase
MTRSGFFMHLGLGALGSGLTHKQVLAFLSSPTSSPVFFYIGCYTQSADEGIAECRFEEQKGTIQLSGVCKSIDNPSFLIFGNRRKWVYAVNETADFGDKKSGGVSSFLCDQKTGKLTFLNSQASLGAHPCHLTMDRQGKFILVANYSGGNVAVLPILANGELGEAVDIVQHTGKSINANRQEGPHAHSVNLSHDNRFAFVCDLGIDKIMIYRFNQKTGKLSPSGSQYFQTAPGAGPRHFTFSNDGRNAFVVNELNSTITSFRYNQSSGELTEIQTLSTLPDGFTEENTCADIHVHPNGSFVYASNRGHNSIAVFQCQAGFEKLKLVQNQSTLGQTPRNFAIHPSGRYLLAANQNSNSVHVFSIDPSTGLLSETGNPGNPGNHYTINKPVCILF